MRLAPVLLAGALALAGCGKSETPADDAPAASETADAAPAIAPTAAMGEQVFRRCVACHTVEKGGSHGIGPNLPGVAGALVASKPGFSYSGAMKAKGGVWDETAPDAHPQTRKSVVAGK